jgi:hypothetical protein
MTELRDRLERELLEVPISPRSATDIITRVDQRGRRRVGPTQPRPRSEASGKRMALAAGLALTTALIVGLVWITLQHPELSRSPAAESEVPGGSGTLRLDHITITDPLNHRSQVEAQALAVWSGHEFPGFFECAFVALDRDGGVVGRYEDVVASLSSPVSFPVEVDASSPATSMEGDCGSRLDTGIPYRYDFSNIHVGKRLTASFTNRAAVVGFDAKWAGGGQAGAVRCRVTIRDDAGAIVGSEFFNFYLLTGSGTDLAQMVEVHGTPVSADISCSPFSG